MSGLRGVRELVAKWRADAAKGKAKAAKLKLGAQDIKELTEYDTAMEHCANDLERELAALSLPPSPQAANEHDAIQVVSHERDEAVAAVLKLIAELRKRDISVQDHNAKFGGDIHVVTGEHQRTAFFSKEAAEEYLAKQDPEVFKIVVYAKPVGEQRELTAEQAEKIDEIISRHKTDAFDSFHAADDLSDYLFGGINYPGIFAVHRAPAGAQGQVQGVQASLEKLADKWDSADYAIAEVKNPLLPQEQCAIELRQFAHFWCWLLGCKFRHEIGGGWCVRCQTDGTGAVYWRSLLEREREQKK